MNVYEFIKPHINKPNLEVEFRIGKRNGTLFDTNIGKETFEKIHRRLTRYPEWDQVKTQNACVFYGLRKGLRIVYDEQTDEQVVICKHSLGTLDIPLEDVPFDVRVSVSLETPTLYDNEKDKFPIEKKRTRTSFIRKGLSIDMSIVQNLEHDSEDELVYQLELEIIKPTDDSVKIRNHYQKVFDVLKLLN